MNALRTTALIFVAIFLLMTFFGGYYIVGPTQRGVKVTLGKMSDEALKPGLGLKLPWITTVKKIEIKQKTSELTADCFSSDLQHLTILIKVLYRVPERSVVRIERDYTDDFFQSLILPRVQESIKEVTATKTAQEIVKTREEIKIAALDSSRKKVGEILELADLVIEDVKLSPDLERAIEAKMVQQQEAEKAVYRETQAETEAKIAVVKAKGEAEAIKIQGEALEKAPKLIELKMVEKWNGVSPQVVSGGGGGGNILLPIAPQLPAAQSQP